MRSTAIPTLDPLHYSATQSTTCVSCVPNHPDTRPVATSNTSLGTRPASYATLPPSAMRFPHSTYGTAHEILVPQSPPPYPPRNNILGPASSGTRQTGRTPLSVTLFDGCPLPAKPLLAADEAEPVFPNWDIPTINVCNQFRGPVDTSLRGMSRPQYSSPRSSHDLQARDGADADDYLPAEGLPNCNDSHAVCHAFGPMGDPPRGSNIAHCGKHASVQVNHYTWNADGRYGKSYTRYHSIERCGGFLSIVRAPHYLPIDTLKTALRN